MPDLWEQTEAEWQHVRWRRQAVADVKQFVVWLTVVGLLLGFVAWITSDIEVLGAPAMSEREPVNARRPVPALAPSPWLTEGTSGEQVTDVQTILAGHSYTITIDGDYGGQTARVVESFQRSSGLLPDAIVGPVTWAALDSVRPAVRLGNAQPVTPTRPPLGIGGDCDTWRPRIEAGPIPWDWAKRIADRESGCWHPDWVHGVDSDDHSHGGFQVNIKAGYMERWLAASGYTHDVLHTTEGAIQAAEAMYLKCGPVPWGGPPYEPGCGGELRRYQP